MPNNDTPYSWAWVDVRSEPWVLIQPPADGDRFYSSVWGDLWGHIIGYPGSVNEGQNGGTYVFAPTSWKGETPAGVDRVIYGETTILGTLTRTAVFGPDDLPNTQKIQQAYQLMPLSKYLKQPAPPAAPEPKWPVWNEGDMTNADFFKLTNFLMQFVVPNDADKPIYEKMAKLGIGPRGDYDPANCRLKFSLRSTRASQKATKRSWTALRPRSTQASSTALANSWERDTLIAPSASRLAASFRTFRSKPSTASGPRTRVASRWTARKPSYTFTFPKGQLPPVRFFWSLTMYDLKTRLLVDNPIDRYSIGDRTEGLKNDPDGSLTIYVQKESPGKDKESNWLPAPDGPMSIISRMYGPDERFWTALTSFLTRCGRAKTLPRGPVLAHSGHDEVHCTCLLSGVKRTSACALHMSAFGGKAGHRSCPAVW